VSKIDKYANTNGIIYGILKHVNINKTYTPKGESPVTFSNLVLEPLHQGQFPETFSIRVKHEDVKKHLEEWIAKFKDQQVEVEILVSKYQNSYILTAQGCKLVK
jgi:hypothetical protein